MATWAQDGDHNTMSNMGTHQMYGLSPVFDLQEPVSGGDADEGGEEPLNILLGEPGDIRHVLRTLSARRRHSKRPIHFYIFEKHPECLARHLLLLQIVHDWELPIRQRCNLWLEVFGNCLVQERTSKYVAEKGLELIQLICNEAGAMRDLIDIGLLKFKQRDELEDVFKSWSEKVAFDMVGLRDTRLRHMYGQRFDVKKNLIDWDYRQALRECPDFGIIHIKQYREWRDTGIAFEFGDQSYTIPNRSMASFAEGRKQTKGAISQMVKGFWLDIVIGPYLGFGVHSETPNKYAEGLYQILDKGTGTERWRHNTAEVAVYNVLGWLHEIETGEQYQMAQEHQIYSGLGDEEKKGQDDSTIFDGGEEEKMKKAQEAALNRARCIVESMSDAKVSLLAGKFEDVLFKKKKFNKFFHRVFLSTQQAHQLGTENFANILADSAAVTVESPRFVFALDAEKKAGYSKRVEEMATACGLRPCYDKLSPEAEHFSYVLSRE